MTDDTRPPHTWVSEKMGFSVAGVSLLRSGSRLPSFDAMLVVEREFDWGLTEQTTARVKGIYAAEFEKALEAAYIKERDDAG